MSENWMESLNWFYVKMQSKLQDCTAEKGEPTKERLSDCPIDYLEKKLKEHLEVGHYVDVANFAFLLNQKKATNKPACFSHFPREVPPMMEDCYKNCKGSIILCKQATHEREEQTVVTKPSSTDSQ